MQECPQFQCQLGTTWEPHFPLILFRGGTQKQPTTTTTIKKAPSPTPPKHRRLHILASSFHTTCRRPPLFFEGADAYTDPETHRGRLFAPLPANPFWWAFLLPLLSLSLSHTLFLQLLPRPPQGCTGREPQTKNLFAERELCPRLSLSAVVALVAR